MPTEPEPSNDDPFEAHFRREPLAGAGVLVVVFASGDVLGAWGIAQGLVSLMQARKRPVDWLVTDETVGGFAEALTGALRGATQPLVLVTNAFEPWTAAHLDPLLEAIDRCDHVLGRRPAGPWGSVRRWLVTRLDRLVYGVPLLDIHSPCRLHRREKLASIPFQSKSSFLDIEILAKATFLGHLLDEVPVPALARKTASESRSDRSLIFRRPLFVRESGPAEEAQSEEEGADGPGGEDRQGDQDRPVAEAGPFQNDQP